MTTESDPYVIYGGDPTETDKVDADCPSLGAMVMSDFQLGEDKTCFINGATNEKWTYKDMLEQTSLLARVLYGAGIRQNDVVSIVSENRFEFPAIVFGAFYLSAIVAPINTTYTERELKHSLQLSKPRFVFTAPSTADQTLKVCKKLKFVERVIVFGRDKLQSNAISLHDFIQKYEKKDFNVEKYVAQRVSRDQVAYIANSSGTTGMPKAVLITQMNIMSIVQGMRDTINLAKQFLGDNIVGSSVAPWFHSMGFFAMIINACSRDATFVFLPKFDNESFLRCIQEYKISTVSVVPPIMVFLAKSPLVDKYDLSSLISIACGAAALSKEVEDQVRERFLKNYNTEVMIRQAYGMSESTLRTIASTLVVKPGSVGQVLPGIYCKVVDENGKSLGPHQQGELCFKGPVIMKGYLNDTDATNNAIDKNGWLHTGDIGYYDEDEHFFIVDRLKELIKYNANQVAPAELEALLLSNSKVKDCCVIGIPDEKAGELPFAYVVKQPGVQLTEKEIVQFVADNTSKVKRLRGGAKFVDEIPRNASGKILRRQMRDMYKASKSKL
ncbi:4-coumarate--CoA ligase 1-like [Bradysia coprophila]|uniref:4-coumarate--CoA ligase 1-like n=1 Tax=Bradysia coprophila TaxID=38358 RepID=UPI00187DBCA1|nr:4-coumarate--CoA ligase 1-like [Bradysia coprophila]